MKQKILFWILGLLAAIGIFFMGASYGTGLTTRSASERTGVSEQFYSTAVLINNGDTVRGYQTAWRGGKTVLEVIKSVTAEHKITFDYDPPEKSTYGAFIKQIGDKKNGTGKKYWQYWVNGLQPQMAADKYILKSGDTVLWTFSESTL
ncbi:MAG: DUF4430 domain-containing protein [Patescibacteria group bacterium]